MAALEREDDRATRLLAAAAQESRVRAPRIATIPIRVRSTSALRMARVPGRPSAAPPRSAVMVRVVNVVTARTATTA
jgi:hypothetical protein